MEEEFATRLLSITSQGQLMAWLTTLDPAGEERRHAIDCMAQLHRTRRIDVFEHLFGPADVDEWRLDYGSWSRVYRDLVPLLDDEAGRVVSAVVGLGTGLWEVTFHEAFLDWCSRDGKRVDEVLALEPLPEIPDFCFAAALIAGLRTTPTAYLDVAIAYAQGARRSRMPGIRAIGAMSVQNDAAVQRAVTALGGVLDDANAAIRDRADALAAALDVAQRCDGSLDGTVSCMVARATASGRAELIARVLPHPLSLRCPAACRPSAIFVGGPAGRWTSTRLKRAPQRTLRSTACLPRAGRKMRWFVSKPCFERARRTSRWICSDRRRTTWPARTRTSCRVVICRWLLTGDRASCAAARHLITSTGDQKFKFDFDPGNRDWPGRRTLYLARKAIGWLMPHGTAPASFLVCLLRGASGDVAHELGELLFDPLLVNYPLATRSYLEAVHPKSSRRDEGLCGGRACTRRPV